MSENSPRPKGSYKKLVFRYILFIVGIFVLYNVVYNAIVFVRSKLQEQGVAQVAQNLKDMQAQEDAKRRADTTGGKTPQETLDLYIAAVEKGDYDLASKYFVWWNQEKERKSFEDFSVSDAEKYLDFLRRARISGGDYSLDKLTYGYHDPIFIELIKYTQTNIWKIVEI